MCLAVAITVGALMKRVLIDEGVPHGIRDVLVDAEVFSVQWLGWGGVKNGELIRRVNDRAFEVIITNDQNWRFQQNQADWDFSVIELSSNSWPVILGAIETGNLSARLNDAVRRVAKGEIIHFDVGGSDT